MGLATLATVLAIVLVAFVVNSSNSGDQTVESAPAESTTTVRPTTTTTTTTTTTVPLAALEASLTAEARRACDLVLAQGGDPAATAKFDPKWEAIGADAAALNTIVVDCVTKAREALIATATPVDVDAIVKNPDATVGQVFVLGVQVWQFDAATGPCHFLAYWDGEPRNAWYDYAGANAAFFSNRGKTPCPALDGFDQDDVARVWAQSTGAYSYDMQSGGSTVVPSFEVLKVEIIQKR